jgi:hypothetical protein
MLTVINIPFASTLSAKASVCPSRASFARLPPVIGGLLRNPQVGVPAFFHA